jgi:hypothetical protein
MLFVTISGFFFAYSKPFSSPPAGSYPTNSQKKGIFVFALRADAFDEGVLDVVDLRIVERRVIEQNLDCVGAHFFFDPAHRAVWQQIGQASGLRIVVTAVLVCKKQSGILCSSL